MKPLMKIISFLTAFFCALTMYCLKTAKIIPIYKKGDRSNLNNYRPIALLPVISKVFEKVINS